MFPVDNDDSSDLRQPLLQSTTLQQTISINHRPTQRIDRLHQGAIDATSSTMLNSRSQVDKKGNKNKQKNEIDGLQAWLTLACIFIINANTLGSLKIYGLIFEEIVAQKYYNREEASWPVSTASTIQNLAGLLTPMLALKLSWRYIETLQTLLFVMANIGAYLSGSLAMDIFCLGVVQGVALSIRYNMNVVINNEYFVKYRATAMGISLAGSTCGVFVLKPLIAHVLDTSNHQFRNAYLALSIVVSFNLLLGFLIRKPKQVRKDTVKSRDGGVEESLASGGVQEEDQDESVAASVLILLKNPSIHCIWIMQTVYFYISRTYTIFLVDYGVDKGFSRQESRNMLDFWVYGELGGRLLLGTLIDLRLLSLKWNIIIVNVLLSLSGFCLLTKPTIFGDYGLVQQAVSASDSYYFWLFGISVSLVAALSSLTNMLIVPFGQEYLGKKNVPWAFALGSVITSIFLLLRPSLIGWSRDDLKSYDPLIVVMSSGPALYAFLFMIVEPFLRRYKIRANQDRESTP